MTDRARASRRRTRPIPAAVAAAWLATAACYPTTGAVGIAHPNAVPPAGNEVSLFGIGGASLFTAVWGGGGISYAGRVGDYGIQAGAWSGGAGGYSEGTFFGADLTLAIPVAPSLDPPDRRFHPIPLPPGPEGLPEGEVWDPSHGEADDWPDWGAPRTRYHVLIGARLEGVMESVEEDCVSGESSCPSPPDYQTFSYLVPQLSLGLVRNPQKAGLWGGFWTLRLEGGPLLDLVEGFPVTRGQVAIGGGGGIQTLLWRNPDGPVLLAFQGDGRVVFVMPESERGGGIVGVSLGITLSVQFDFGD